MTPNEFSTWLACHDACIDALEWVDGKTLAEAWSLCPRPAWMLWLVRLSGVRVPPGFYLTVDRMRVEGHDHGIIADFIRSAIDPKDIEAAIVKGV